MAIGVEEEERFLPFGGGFAEETYRSLLYQEIGRQMSASGGVGIADAVYAEMVKLQGDVK